MELLILLIGLVAAAVQGAAGSFIMGVKGRSEGAGFALGFLLGALGLLIVLVLEERYSSAGGRKAPPAQPKAPRPELPANLTGHPRIAAWY